MALFVAGVAFGLLVAAVVSGHIDKWLDIRTLKAEKELIEVMRTRKRSADGGASTDQSDFRKETFL